MNSRLLTLIVAAGLTAGAAGTATAAFSNFITARDGQLWDGDQPFRFISFNIPNLLLLEDNMIFAEKNAWRLPDAYETTDALATLRQLGGTVARTYSITVVRGSEPPAAVSQVLGPGQFNEAAFQAMDLVLQTANEQGVRLIIPLVNNWPWMGGRAEYAKFRGKTKDEFWTDPQLIADFETTIRYVLNRTNTLTGVRYADDKAILCWETGNELQCPAAWTRTISAYIKSLDPRHLVMDGNTSGMRTGSLDLPDVDIVTTHHYSAGRNGMAEVTRDRSHVAMRRRRVRNCTWSANSASSAPRKWRRRSKPSATAARWAGSCGACVRTTGTAGFTGTANPAWAATAIRRSTGRARLWARIMTKSI